MSEHALAMVVDGTPETLTRVVVLCRRRGFVIESLTFDRTDVPGIAQIALRVRAGGHRPAQQLLSQLDKVIGVLRVTESTALPAAVPEPATPLR